MMERKRNGSGLWMEAMGGESGRSDEEMILILTAWEDCADEDGGLAVAVGSDHDHHVRTTLDTVGCTLMVLSILANVAVFLATPFKINERNRLCSLHILLRHLVVSDVLVTSIFLAKEIGVDMEQFDYGWSSWIVGELACRTVGFLSEFGLYASGFLVASIALDRCLAVRKPVSASKAVQRAHRMAWTGWAASVICSTVEAAVYQLDGHSMVEAPCCRCDLEGTFPSWALQLAYASVKRAFSFAFPFCMVIVCYPCMLWGTWPNHTENANGEAYGGRSAGRRTLKVSLAVVLLFFICWAPQNIVSLWSFADRGFHLKVSRKVIKMLRLLACANSGLNPILYGYYYLIK